MLQMRENNPGHIISKPDAENRSSLSVSRVTSATLAQQGAVPTSLLTAGLIPQTAWVSSSHGHVHGKADVLVCVSGTALGHWSQTLPWPNCTDVGGAAVVQGYAFLSSEEQLQEGTDTRETITINSSAMRHFALVSLWQPVAQGRKQMAISSRVVSATQTWSLTADICVTVIHSGGMWKWAPAESPNSTTPCESAPN